MDDPGGPGEGLGLAGGMACVHVTKRLSDGTNTASVYVILSLYGKAGTGGLGDGSGETLADATAGTRRATTMATMATIVFYTSKTPGQSVHREGSPIRHWLSRPKKPCHGKKYK